MTNGEYRPLPTESLRAEPPPGLPPVVPPTGKFLAQLFIVPGVIVVVALVLLLCFSWLFGGPATPQKFLDRLDNTNSDVRWRAASDLAQVLLRDDKLAGDAKFALDLATRLRRELAENATQETATRADDPKQRQALLAERNYVIYLSACLGNCAVPAGAPLLGEIAVKEDRGDARAVARQRWRAVWALANLGENLKRFDRLPPDRQAAALAQLETEADGAGSSERSSWAALALNALRGRQSGMPQAIGVDQTLSKCAGDRNPFLREAVALALNFWEGTDAENALMERTLLKLSHDDGHGEELLDPFFDDDEEGKAQPAEGVVTSPGLRIRYQAATALARRGSVQAPLGLLQDMLDADSLRERFRVRLKDGRSVPDETVVQGTLLNALRAAVELHSRRPGVDLSALRPAVMQQTQSANVAVKAEAERTLLALDGK